MCGGHRAPDFRKAIITLLRVSARPEIANDWFLLLPQRPECRLDMPMPTRPARRTLLKHDHPSAHLIQDRPNYRDPARGYGGHPGGEAEASERADLPLEPLRDLAVAGEHLKRAYLPGLAVRRRSLAKRPLCCRDYADTLAFAAPLAFAGLANSTAGGGATTALRPSPAAFANTERASE